MRALKRLMRAAVAESLGAAAILLLAALATSQPPMPAGAAPSDGVPLQLEPELAADPGEAARTGGTLASPAAHEPPPRPACERSFRVLTSR